MFSLSRLACAKEIQIAPGFKFLAKFVFKHATDATTSAFFIEEEMSETTFAPFFSYSESGYKESNPASFSICI